MKPPILNIENNKEGLQYLPMDILINQFNELLVQPYTTRFSFLPFIQKMNNRVQHTNCEITATMIPQIEALEARIANNNGAISVEEQQQVDQITNILLPSMFFEGEHSFVCPPFTKDYVYTSPSLAALKNDNKWLVRFDISNTANIITPIQQVAAFILNKVYGLNIESLFTDVITFRNTETELERHYKLVIRDDFIQIHIDGDQPELSRAEINDLLNNLNDDEKILQYLPLDKFSFTGFGIGVFTDITEHEIQSSIKDNAIRKTDIKHEELLSVIKGHIRNYLNRNDIDIGIAEVYFEGFYNNDKVSLSGCKDFKKLKHSILNENHCHAYKKAYCHKLPVIIDDIGSIQERTVAEEGLHKKGYKSILLAPLLNSNKEVTSILEIASKEKYSFSKLDITRLEPIFDILNIANDVYLRDLNNGISQYIKNQFTTIHPSVEWKFEEVATKHVIKEKFDDENREIEEIVFKDVYPLYGQADIVNSSQIRNESIQLDLIDNLERVLVVLRFIDSTINFHLLAAYLEKTEMALSQIKENYTSSLESYILDLLNNEVHPLIRQLVQEYDELPNAKMDDYFKSLDHDLGIVYNRRRDYETSVTKLNTAIATYLNKEDQIMQDQLPHYFEKYKTDGVEYNIYLGQSILKNKEFTAFHLKNFRLWQLVNICEITRIVDGLKSELPIPLETAQLIFVFNSPLSIRFRMDEKQFDVDGTYNVRYEILKKRIDKALLKGTNERLSQAGKISIVYLLESDKKEYLEYLGYLISKGYIKEEIEDLELEKLQGADGLRALRVEVINQ
ncbi:MAG: hypothetical protein R2753_05940 [Chitinophagales bacterium]